MVFSLINYCPVTFSNIKVFSILSECYHLNFGIKIDIKQLNQNYRNGHHKLHILTTD